MQNEFPLQITPDFSLLSAKIRQWGKALGFQDIGISDVDLSAAELNLLQWLEKGFHGTMDYMAKHGSRRSRPAELVPGTLRVISVRMNYLPEAVTASSVLQDRSRAYISRYALGRDYHKVMRNRLEKLVQQIRAELPSANFRVFSDSAPVLEVALAEKAGLGWRGKHTLLLCREHGSWFFLAEIYTDIPLPTDEEQHERLYTSHCGSCTACIDMCPTGAIVAPYVVDARRCISYLTIELKGSIPEELRPMMGNRIYGCDDCQLACPWNRFAKFSEESDFAIRNGLDDVMLADLFAWDEETFKARFSGSAIYRIGHEQWLRNIAVALGNALPSDSARSALLSRRNSPSAVVREHVEWALARG